MNLQVVGLGLDLLGVALLGVDLIRIQNDLRSKANERIDRLNELAEEFGGVEEWADDIAKSANWAEYADIGERIFEPIPGSFDAGAAKESFGEAMQAVGIVAARADKVSGIVLAAYQSDKESAKSSLIYSYLGLALILTGFGLQIISMLSA